MHKMDAELLLRIHFYCDDLPLCGIIMHGGNYGD